MAEEEGRNLEVMFKKLRNEMNKHRKEAEKEKLKFVELTEKELWRRLSKAETPYIGSTGYTDWTEPGGTIWYQVGVYNPDEITRRVYVYVFVGPANFVDIRGRAVLAVDERFPRLIEPARGLELVASGGSGVAHFPIAVPDDIERTNYMANAFLFQPQFFKIGTMYDRGSIIFEVR